MKKHLSLYILPLFLCLAVSIRAQVVNTLGEGELHDNVWYAIYDNTEYSGLCHAFHITIHQYNYSVPGDKLTLEAKNTWSAVNGKIYINANGSKNADHTINHSDLSNKYQSFGSYSIPRSQRTLYVRAGDGSLNRYIRNLHLTMASYLDAPSVSSLTFSEQATGSTPETKTFTFDWCNTGSVLVTYSGDDAFSVTTTSIPTDGKYGNATISVTCNHTCKGSHTGTVTITNGTVTHTVSLRGSTKALSQSITWNVTDTDLFTSESFLCTAEASSGLPVSYTSSDTRIAEVASDGTLLIHTAGEVTITATQSGNCTYSAASSVSYTFHITRPVREWITLLPDKGDIVLAASDTLYHNLLYWVDTNTANLLGSTPADITQAQYIILPVCADQWTTFVPPFDITDVQVLELIPETELQNLTRTEAIRLQQERVNLLAEYLHSACNDLSCNQSSLQQIISALFQTWTTQYNYASDALGIYPITHYDGTNLWDADYYAYTTSSVWSLSDETQSGLQKQWQPVKDDAGTLFRRGQVYALQFPYCTGCNPSDNYDYWSGKLVLMSHYGTQTVYGEDRHEELLATAPSEGSAELIGNYTLCSLHADDVYIHEKDPNSAWYDCFLRQESALIMPTQPLMFVNSDAAQTHRPIAVRRSGELLYAPDEEDNTSTSLKQLYGTSSLQAKVSAGTLELTMSVSGEVRIYTMCGQLLSCLSVRSGQPALLHLPQGFYLLSANNENTKIIIP
ncbi:MAG TPA: hypothetical protein DIW30_06475 [Bacteroidales bacterium]|nr:hypothetical protein [Bacteroidales bacterium]